MLLRYKGTPAKEKSEAMEWDRDWQDDSSIHAAQNTANFCGILQSCWMHCSQEEACQPSADAL